jgi:hypothetical protein
VTGLPGFLNHDTPLNRALLCVAWHRTDPFGDAFDGLAGDIAELAGLDRDVVVRGLADVADELGDWGKCCPGCDDVIAARALPAVARLIDAAHPKLAVGA